MKCKFCGQVLPDEKTGKRQRWYCNDTCKQKAYRRRLGGHAPASEIYQQLVEAKLRIMELERFAVKHAPAGYRKKREIPEISLADMVRRHGIASQPVETTIVAKRLKPVDGCLDAEQQEAFWQLFNGQAGWHDCENCPHGVIP